MTLDDYSMQPRLKELPAPTPGPDEVLVRVRATSVNPIDWKQASGKARPILFARFPDFIPGYDLAGEIVTLGANVKGFSPAALPAQHGFSVGQRVHTRLLSKNGGANAELVVAQLDVLRPMPSGIDFGEAAALPLAGMTALQGLRDGCGLKLEGATERVCIIGASGGVGHFAVQLARAMGAHVTGVCSSRNVELVRTLGANEVVDYTKSDAWQGVAPFDVIYDCVGSAPGDWLERLTPHGRFASCLPGPAVFAHAALNLVRGRKVAPVLLKPNAVDLGVLDGFVERGAVRVVVDSRFPLEKLADAWARSASGRAAGKIVIELA